MMKTDNRLGQAARNTITIDGREIPFQPGQTIIDAALEAGIYIPHLCHRSGLSPHGSCRLCMVEIVDRKETLGDSDRKREEKKQEEARSRSVAACTMPATAGQWIRNDTPALNEARKAITQMLFTEGNHICPSCEHSGNCTLQAVAYFLGMLDGHFPPFFPQRDLDASHPTIMLDRDRCILCELCVRASREVDGKNVFAIAGRGTRARLIVNSASGRLVDSDIEMHDLAVHVCPVGAILIKEQGYRVPIGQRIFDLHQVDETGLEETLLTEKGQK